jgi:membrane-associated PAP2 superfamily phosphatase
MYEMPSVPSNDPSHAPQSREAVAIAAGTSGTFPSVTGEPASLAAFWWQRIRIPLAVFAVLATLFAFTQTDIKIAHAVFFDGTRHDWIGAQNWWVNRFLHAGGTWFIRLLVVAALVTAGLSLFNERLRAFRRPALYFALSVILSVGTVGALKTITNKDCPRDLTEFGGEHAYVSLFDHRPADLRGARCFPAAHASAGYALLALYFALRERNRRWSKYGLAIGVLMGLIFGISQQSRGAHFISHDVWSAFIVWTVALSTYVGVFRARLWGATADLGAG